MKLRIQLLIVKLHIIHVLQSDNINIWDNKWYIVSNVERDFECINQQQYCCRSDENQHDNDHHVLFWRLSSLEF